MKELGIEELSLEYWAGIWAPAGTPADIVRKAQCGGQQALQSP
jgi:tripartite-type tricarboxylate transporter receptor subunit TctC